MRERKRDLLCAGPISICPEWHAKHDYRVEPNVTFTPDGRWVVFRSNLHGPTHVYAVEVSRAK